MKNRLLFLLSLAIVTLVSCTEKCDDPDVQRINSLFFELKQGGDDGFTPEQLDSIYYVRFVPFSDPLIADTVFTEGFYPEGEAKFLINDNFPIPNQQAPYYPVYYYEIIEPTSGFSTIISDIELQGSYLGECDYENTLKAFKVDGDSINMPGSMDFYLLTR
jgi:hypothetical protein